MHCNADGNYVLHQSQAGTRFTHLYAHFKRVVVFLEQICNNFTSKSNSPRINVDDGNLSSLLLMWLQKQTVLEVIKGTCADFPILFFDFNRMALHDLGFKIMLVYVIPVLNKTSELTYRFSTLSPSYL